MVRGIPLSRSPQVMYSPTLGNSPGSQNVYRGVMQRKGSILLLLAVVTAAAYDNYVSAKHKFDLIEAERLPAGSRVSLSYPELEAWVAHEAPDGVRSPRIQVTAPGLAIGAAQVDFAKVRRSQGQPPGWLMSKLLEGERPVSVTARIRSSRGTATVDVERVEISGVTIDGRTLEFLIQNVLLPLYPGAAVGHPFALSHRIERLDVAPAATAVVIGK